MKSFTFYSTYEVLVSVLNIWNVDTRIQMENTLLSDGEAGYEYQPESPDNWVLIPDQPEFVCMTLGKTKNSYT